MSINNRYIYRSKISEAKFRELVRYFCDDLDATQITSLSGLNRNTVNRYLKAIRERIAEHCESESTVTSQAEGDESLFGPHRVQIRPAGDATTRTTVFGIIKQYSKVHTRIVTDGAKDSPKKGVIAGMASRDRVACADELPGGEGVEEDAENEFVRNLSRINGIEGFWSIAKMRLVKFRGVNKNTFYLHLKECEFRYNHRNENLYLKILKIVREKPLFQESP
jgi:transposase-like protein